MSCPCSTVAPILAKWGESVEKRLLLKLIFFFNLQEVMKLWRKKGEKVWSLSHGAGRDEQGISS